jgi:uncharacterized protein (DUF302 family)
MVRTITVSVILVIFSMSAVTASDEGKAFPVKVYKIEGELQEVKEDVEFAIIDRGLLVSGTLHISEMLNRTAKDLGYTQPVYKEAESVEFCSAYISHLIVSTHPANAVVCPFTIAVYVLESEPNTVYLAYQKPQLAGDAGEATKETLELLDGIVRDAIE